MDEPAQNEDMTLDVDQTQPTEEIAAALNGKASTNSVKTEPDNNDVPKSEFDALYSQLSEKPHDLEGWKRLIDLAKNSGEVSKIHQVYDELLKHYPNTSSAQIAYISHFLQDESKFPEAEQLFIKFLRSSPSVDLWKFYLTYVRRRNTGPSTRETVRKSYEFALNHVGQDKDSGEIWDDYIKFLKDGTTSTTWEEQQKMDTLRKAYHRAVQIPLDNVERLWSELEAFETNLNKITAKKFMSDLSPAHMQARAVLRQLTNHLNPLFPTPPPPAQELYLPPHPTFDANDRALIGKWKAYLKWEEGNPLEIEEKDKPTLVTRIQGVYRKAVIRMRFYSEIWYMAYNWTNSLPGKQEDALTILKAGLEANPASPLLTFAYAEAMELKKDFAEVHSTYDKFFAAFNKVVEEIAAREGGVKDENPSQPQAGAPNGSFGQPASDGRPGKSSELQEARKDLAVAWVMYLRFARRAESQAGLRKVFLRARKDKWASWEVYEASALMEYHCFDDKTVACRIFDKGLDIFGNDVDYVCRYLGFLISINDHNNARALFERVITTFLPERARTLWERWGRYEYQYGDLENTIRLEKRIQEAYPNDPPIKRFAQRHTYLGSDAIASRDVGTFFMRREKQTPNSSQAKIEPGPQGNAPTGKRPASPDHPRTKREETRNFDQGGGGGGGGYKRQKGNASPTRDVHMRDRDRDHRDRGDRWGDNRGRRSPPPQGLWLDREKDDRDGGGRGYGGGRDLKREESFGGRNQPQVHIPLVVSGFVGDLPPASSFDGPIFKVDDLMKCFKQAIIPSHTGAGPNGPPPSRVRSPSQSGPSNYNQRGGGGGGRPPPDYGPYQGPGGGRGGRRY